MVLGISRLEMSSPSSARMAIGVPTSISLAPSATLEKSAMSPTYGAGVTVVFTHKDLSKNTVFLRINVEGCLVGFLFRRTGVKVAKRMHETDATYDFEQDIARNKRLSFLLFPAGDTSHGHGRGQSWHVHSRNSHPCRGSMKPWKCLCQYSEALH